MLTESVRAILNARAGRPAPLRKPGQHNWIHGLPLKMRFKRSKLYVSVIPVVALGIGIGFLGALLGVGGGFILVPALIYLLRVPTNVVIGSRAKCCSSAASIRSIACVILNRAPSPRWWRRRLAPSADVAVKHPTVLAIEGR